MSDKQESEELAPEVAALRDWLHGCLPASIQVPAELQLQPLTGDAGFRRYFRLNTQPSLMAVFAPPTHENNPAFVSKALALRAQGVHTPRIFAVDYQHGFMLLEDFGDDLYSEHLGSPEIESLYSAAEQTLLTLQQTAPNLDVFPAYDDQLLHQEMGLLPEWFLEKLLGLQLTNADHQMLQQTFELLAANALEQPQVVVHRDYHCRNLMVLPEGGVGVIDFQDGVIGAITYDLVSLLKDCYVRWPRDWVLARVREQTQQLRNAGLLANVDDQAFIRWFDLMGLQRHIKVLGIFARLWLRDGKARYLDDLPLVVRYTMEMATQYPELEPFRLWFEQRVLPLLPSQEWYRDWQTAGDSQN